MQTQPSHIVHDVGTRLEGLLKGQRPERLDVSLYEVGQDRGLAGVVNQLIETFDEIQQFILPLSQGRLSEFVPCKGNVLASPFKELHAQLKHLTWQTQRIAEGDFRQKVDFMGEFSLAFNTMVEKLAQREEQLARAKIELEQIDLPYGWWARGELDRLGCHRHERNHLWQTRVHDRNATVRSSGSRPPGSSSRAV